MKWFFELQHVKNTENSSMGLKLASDNTVEQVYRCQIRQILMLIH